MGKKSIANGAVVGSDVDTIVVLTPGATVTVDTSLGGIFTVTPGEAETLNATNLTNGERFAVVVSTVGTTSYTLTFNTGFKTTGTLATGTVTAKTFIVTFLVIGGVATETGRTTAL